MFKKYKQRNVVLGAIRPFEPFGLALLDLLITIAIIVVLSLLTFTAIQASRESARNISCLNKIRQLCLAVNSYTAVEQKYPAFYFFSRHVALLPHLEYQNLYDQINLAIHRVDRFGNPQVQNHTVRRTIVSLFLCPSDSNEHLSNSYHYNIGASRNTSSSQRGPFSHFRPLRHESPASVADGLSHTAMISERLGGSFSHTPNPKLDWEFKGGHSGPTTATGYLVTCDSKPTTGWFTEGGRYWLYEADFFSLYDHSLTPNSPRPSCATASEGVGLNPPRSYHRSHVNLGYCDGHVTEISDNISFSVWQAIATREGGESTN